MLPSQQDPADKPDNTDTDTGTTDGDGGGQVSEVSGMDGDEGPQREAPGDATAGYPDSESGSAQEGEAGPNAAPRHDSPRSGASSAETDRG